MDSRSNNNNELLLCKRVYRVSVWRRPCCPRTTGSPAANDTWLSK